MSFKEEENPSTVKKERLEALHNTQSSSEEYEEDDLEEIIKLLESLDILNKDSIVNTLIHLLSHHDSSFLIPEIILDNICELYILDTSNINFISLFIELLECCDNQSEFCQKLLDERIFHKIKEELFGENSDDAIFLLKKLLHRSGTDQHKLDVLPILKNISNKVYLDVLTSFETITPYFFKEALQTILEMGESGDIEAASQNLHNLYCFLDSMEEDSFEVASEVINCLIETDEESAIAAISFLNILFEKTEFGLRYFESNGIGRILCTASSDNVELAECALGCLSVVISDDIIMTLFFDDVFQFISDIFIDCHFKCRPYLLRIIISALLSEDHQIRESVLSSNLLQNAGVLLSSENEYYVVGFLKALDKALTEAEPELVESIIRSELFERINEISEETENADIESFLEYYNPE